MSAAYLLPGLPGRGSPTGPEIVRGPFAPVSVRTVAGRTSRHILLVGVATSTRVGLLARLAESGWQAHEASGGAAAMACIEELRPEALVVGDWLPDLEVGEFLDYVRALHPRVELLGVDGSARRPELVSSRRQELLRVLRESSDEPESEAQTTVCVDRTDPEVKGQAVSGRKPGPASPSPAGMPAATSPLSLRVDEFLPEMVGKSAAMEELGRLVRLVAPRSTTVLIEGDTGTGKELVAKALHRLSSRVNKPFIVLNCAAIPEALLEAELFGHTRGAFTGAVRSRTGRIEAADGGTLFLDEIGEMPLALQAKMLRFLECGELQRVGENEPSYVDVRVIAATHQPLEQRAEEQTFRLDLYHRLAVFPVEVPTLRSRMDDVPLLAGHFLSMLGHGSTTKRITDGAMERLRAHTWPGNVRELMHVLERALILSGAEPEIDVEDIRIRKRDRSL